MQAAQLFAGISLLALSACPAESGPSEPVWTTPVEAQGGALLCVLTQDEEVWVVGAADAQGGTFLHLADKEWTRESTGISEDLWWVAPHPDGRLFVVGGEGMLAQRSTSGEFSVLTTPTDMTLFGVWFNSDGDGWAVGGDPMANGEDQPRGILLRITAGVVEVDDTAPASLGEHLMFKVWGPGGQSDEAYAVGDLGYLIRWDGTSWTESESTTNARLVTIAGDASARAIVGGTNAPVLLLDEGDGLRDISAEIPVGAQGLNGVSVRDGELAVVGNFNLGFAAIRDADGLWISDYVGSGGLHAVSIDAHGEVWAVGGDLLNLDKGYLAHYGTSTVPTGP